MRSAWKELRNRWHADWKPWLEDHPAIVGTLISFALGALVLFGDGLAPGRKFRWSWSDVLVVGGTLLVIIAPALAWFLTGLDIRRRERRDQRLREQRLCLHCRYDMRATPDQCPECGKRANEPVDLFR